jgi:hypothetical protein
VEDIDSLPWEQTLKRFLLSRPTNKEDYDLFVDILNFLHLYLTVRKNGITICLTSKNRYFLKKYYFKMALNFLNTQMDAHGSIRL